MKQLLGFLFVFASFNSLAQCPYISGLMADASNAGASAGEGKNEFVVFNTGAAAVNVNSIFLSYGTSTSTTSFSIDGAASPSIWTSPATSGLITNSAGTITTAMSGLIPANKNVVLISKDNAINYDLQTFGSDVYVLFFDQSLAGVSSFSVAGNYSNTGALPRYLRISQGATCRDTVSYIPDNLPGADGGGVKWNSAGTDFYTNTGASGVVLPVQLLDFDIMKDKQDVLLKWRVSGSSNAELFVIQRSDDGLNYSDIAEIRAIAVEENIDREYFHYDRSPFLKNNFYRIKIKDKAGMLSYSNVQKIFISQSTRNELIYPNPVHQELHIMSENGGYGNVVLLNCYGKVVMLKEWTKENELIDLGHLPEGIYYLKLISDEETKTYILTKE
ncbi:MAG: T9SS type A sorting domain-containing protein [Bacteroidota bacterium]